MPKLHRLQDSVYDRHIFFIVGNAEECNKVIYKKWLLKNAFDDNDDACMLTLEVEKESNKRIMWFKKLSKKPDDIGCVAHECLHVVMSVVRAVGMKPTHDSEEALTYYIESLVKQIYERYDNR